MDDFYYLLFEQNPQPMWVYDIETEQFLAVNQAALRHYGYTAHELLQMHRSDFCRVQSGGAANSPDLLQDAPVQPGPSNGATEIWHLRQHDGSVLSVETTSQSLTFEGRAARLVTGMNSPERLRPESTLRESEDRFRGIFDQAAVGILQTALDGRFLLVNQRFAEIVQDTPENLYRKTFQEITHPEDLAMDLAQVQRLAAGEIQTFSIEKRYVRGDGSIVWVNLSTSLVRDQSGQPLSFVGVVEDIHTRKQAEFALNRREQYFQALIEHSADIIILLDPQHVIQYCSPSMERVLGYAPTQVLGGAVTALMDPEDVPLILETLAAAIAHPCLGQPPIRYRCQHSDGTWRTFEVIITSLLDDPAVQGIVINGRDVSDRVEAEAALRENETRWRLLVEQMPVMMDAFDAHGQVVIWNRECERVTGYSAEEMVNNPRAFELLYPDPEYRQQMFIAWEQRSQTHREWQWSITCKDGSIKRIEWWNIADQHPIPGLQTWGIGIDVTERNRARQEILQLNAQLEQQKQQLEALVAQRTAELDAFINALPDPIFVINREDGRVLFCNDPNARLFGLESRYQVQGQSTTTLYAAVREGPAYARQNAQVFKTGEALREQEVLQLSTGTLHLDTLKVPIRRANGEIYALVGASRDITELVEARQALAERTRQLEITNRELESFSYSISHDLRAPLRHISGFVTALTSHLQAQGLEDARVTHYLQVIHSSSQKMGLLIDGLLTLSRVGRRQLIRRTVDLESTVQEAIALVKSSFSLEDNPPQLILGRLPQVLGDPTLLQQVFVNLLDNALKFSRHAMPPRIEIGYQQGILYVRDNGVGFSMDYADQLFGAFQRLHSVQEFEGTGIGLAIVQRIVHRHGGTIWAEGQPGQGACFYFL